MTQIAANGLVLEYDEFGAADAPVILLIMGLGTQMTAWPVPFCEGLANSGFRVVRFDNRDVGLSSKLEGERVPGIVHYLLARYLGVPLNVPYTLEDMANDVIGLLDAIGIRKAHVVGASMGGMIAQTAVGRFPERFHSLTSMMSSSGDPSLPGPTAAASKQLRSARPDPSSRDSVIQMIMKSYRVLGSPDYQRSGEELRKLASDSFDRSYYPQGFYRQFAAIMASGSRVDLLRTIRTPTLVIHGNSDPLIPVACGVHTAEQIEGARLERIDGMGHDLPPQLLGRMVELIDEHASNVVRIGC